MIEGYREEIRRALVLAGYRDTQAEDLIAHYEAELLSMSTKGG